MDLKGQEIQTRKRGWNGKEDLGLQYRESKTRGRGRVESMIQQWENFSRQQDN